MSYTRSNGCYYNTRLKKVKYIFKKGGKIFCTYPRSRAASSLARFRMSVTSAPTMSSPSALMHCTSGMSKKPRATALTYWKPKSYSPMGPPAVVT